MIKQSRFLVVDACARAHAVFDGLRQTLTELGRTWQKSIKSAEFGRIRSSVDFTGTFVLAEFGRIRSSWQNLAELICRVFHRDIPTVTGLVPLQEVNIFLNLISISFVFNNLNLPSRRQAGAKQAGPKGGEIDHGVFSDRISSNRVFSPHVYQEQSAWAQQGSVSDVKQRIIIIITLIYLFQLFTLKRITVQVVAGIFY